MNFFHASAASKLVAFMAAFVVSVNGELNDHKTSDLSARRSSCSLVVVSTLDGKVSALDTKENGKLLWTLPAYHGPLLSSSLSSIQMAKHVGLIPSLDGGLYQVNGDKVEPIPFTADTLLGSFYKLPDGSILVGGKEATSCGINPSSGMVRYICSADGCHLTETGDGHVQDGGVLVLKRVQQTIRAVDQKTGVERWNFSVGQHDISFLESILSDDDCRCSAQDEEAFVDWNLRISIPNGLVAAVHSHGSKETEVVLWSHKFEAPVAAVWRLSGGFIQPVPLLSHEVKPELADSSSQQAFAQGPVMYVGKHEGQVYIQTSEPFNPAQDNPARIDVSGNTVVQRKPRQITWRPYLTSSPSRTPTVVTKDLAVWNPLEYPFDNGYYLYGEVMPVIPPHTRTEDKKTLPVDSEEVLGGDDNSSDTTVAQPDSSLWWHGAVLVTVTLAILYFLIRCLNGRNNKNDDAVMQLQRIPSKVSSLASSSSLDTLMGPPSPTISSTLTPTNSFISRYLTDFEHELCLGKGGFGLVFQAKNKLDDCQYAIKRIRLPNCDEALEKVRREVKALAKLEHPGIVRYYNSWFEAPPVGWQDEIDAKLYEKGSFCGLPSEVPSFGSGIVINAGPTDEICDRDQNGLQQNKGVRRRKKTNSSSRSRHSSLISTEGDDFVGERVNGESIDIHQLENEVILEGHEISDSFSIEFASSTGKGVEFRKNGFHDDLTKDSASQSIVFRHSDESQNQDVSSIGSAEDAENSSCEETGSSEEMHLTSSHHSLLSREKHKCQNKNCSADRVSAPLYLFIQMQLCKQESLKDWLKANHKRNDVFCLTVFEQILCAVEYFHGRGLMHRDLKPSNIFFSLDGSVKVGDFGLVTAHSSENNIDTPLEGALMDDINHTSQVGTQLYMSPEQVEGKAYSHKVDIFSLGLIFFELFCPFGTQMERIKVMCGVKQRVIPRDFVAKMPLQSELVQWLLSASPKARPNATEVKNSDILKQIRVHENDIHDQ